MGYHDSRYIITDAGRFAHFVDGDGKLSSVRECSEWTEVKIDYKML